MTHSSCHSVLKRKNQDDWQRQRGQGKESGPVNTDTQYLPNAS